MGQQASLASIAASHSQLRGKLVQAAYNSVKAGKLTWPEGESVEEWRSGMVQEGTMGDEVILQAAATFSRGRLSSCRCSGALLTFPLLASRSSVQAAAKPPKVRPRQHQAALPCSCSTTVRAGSSPPTTRVCDQKMEKTTWLTLCSSGWQMKMLKGSQKRRRRRIS